MRKPLRAGELADTWLRSQLDDAGRELYLLRAAWVDCVGSKVAKHSAPLSVKDGELVVGVDDHAWMNQLHFLRADICEKAASFCRRVKIKNVRLEYTRRLPPRGVQMTKPPKARRRKERRDIPALDPLEFSNVRQQVDAETKGAELESELADAIIRARARSLSD